MLHFITTCHFVSHIIPILMSITVVSVPITTVLPLTLSPFPWYYRNLRPYYRSFTAVTAVPIPMQLSILNCATSSVIVVIRIRNNK